MNEMVKIKLPYFPFIKYVPYKQLLNEVRGTFLEQALKQIKETGRKYAEVKCPCCGRIIRISIEEVER
ncbi:hypothetical protein DRJ17_04560 [Candidatus Woesearchaeota archaeon]|nr:MAG: hypothetical protein DRJ17_04560 [Candidatus Woesearchaeota archaeon]